jgi:hypothetical protein
VVDMRPQAVTARLHLLARGLEARGFVSKGVDMSPAAVTGRLRAMAALSATCLRLGKATIVPLADPDPPRG